MNKFEDFIIDEPYNMTEVDLAAIELASPGGVNVYTDWEKSCLNDLKERLRTYYGRKQHRYCAYCRTRVNDSQASAEVEHIVPKSKHPEWMYEPFNMCYSCRMCNTVKGYNKPILANDNTESLPHLSNGYLLIHPHLDNYSRHIEIVDNVLYKGKTKKGKYTIKTCGLNRYALAAERAEAIIRSRGSKSEGYLLALVDTDKNRNLVDVISRYKERIHDMCEEYKALNE